MECRKVTSAEYYSKNREKIRARRVNYYLDKKEYFQVKGKKRYVKNKDKMKEYNTAWSKKNPDNRRNTQLRHNFGISAKDYDVMFMIQNGLCAICEKPETVLIKKTGKIKALSVDHCHKTDKIRALLCNSCNFAVGNLKDDPIIADKAAAYLRKYI
jgi:hypothetical protein